jgi:serine/threonine-protein kinase RsbW
METNSGGESPAVDRYLDSTLESVDNAEQIAVQIAHEVGFEEEEIDRIGMAVRESMVNAVVHGNRYSAHKKVRLSVSKEPQRLIVRITDEGEGFDYEHVPSPLEEENLLRSSGRGIFLIRAFVDEFLVRRLSPSGTEVTLVKYMGSK